MAWISLVHHVTYAFEQCAVAGTVCCAPCAGAVLECAVLGPKTYPVPTASQSAVGDGVTCVVALMALTVWPCCVLVWVLVEWG
jgi:hypothetical protein